MKIGLIAAASFLLVSGYAGEASVDGFLANTYGGSGNDWAYAIQQTTDGGYVLAMGRNEVHADDP